MPCSRSSRWNSSLRWHIPVDRVLEPSLVFHAHSLLDMLSLQLVVRGLLLGVVLVDAGCVREPTLPCIELRMRWRLLRLRLLLRLHLSMRPRAAWPRWATVGGTRARARMLRLEL